jgi:hypothetical protein
MIPMSEAYAEARKVIEQAGGIWMEWIYRPLAIITVLLALAGCAVAAPSTPQSGERLQPRPACTSIGTRMYCQ